MKKLMFLLPILILISSCVAGEGYKQHVEIPDNRNAINIARNIELTKALDDLAKRENGRWVLQLRTDRVRSSVQGQ